jgi:hypothetical protein
MLLKIFIVCPPLAFPTDYINLGQFLFAFMAVGTTVIQNQNIDTDQKHPTGENVTSLSYRTSEEQEAQGHDIGDDG